ncbi:MAG: hypothetical protein U0746_09365 [Gemmataceae bacterium]
MTRTPRLVLALVIATPSVAPAQSADWQSVVWREPQVRYLIADIALGGNAGLYRKYATEEKDPDSREAVRLWDAGARPVNAVEFERKWVANPHGKDGRVMRVVARGTNRTILGSEVVLTSDFGWEQAKVRLVLADLTLGRPVADYAATRNDPNVAEAFRRWADGVRLVHPGRYEAAGPGRVVYRGTTQPADGARIALNSDVAYPETNVRYFMADIALGGSIEFYRKAAEAAHEMGCLEAVRRTEEGYTITNLDRFERKKVDGKVVICRKGSDERISGMAVVLSSDAPDATPPKPAPPPAAAAVPATRPGDLTGHKLLLTSVRTGDTEVFVADPETGDMTNLSRSPGTEDRYPCWSPDGKRVAFTRDRGDHKDLWVMDADGKNQRVLVSRAAACYMPSWQATPGGERIVFGMHGTKPEMASIRPDGSDLTVLGDGHDPTLSPDGTLVCYTGHPPEGGVTVYVMAWDGRDKRRVVAGASKVGATFPNWSPDGTRIVYSFPAGDALELFVVNLDGTGGRQLTRFGGTSVCTPSAWSPDGKWVAFRRTDERYWSKPDRMKVVYAEKPADKRPVWVIRPDGTDARVVEGLRFQCAIDGSRASWKPLAQER